MPLEESVTTSGNTTLTRNFVGARGIEAMATKVGNNTPITSYPLYDVHGNMVATVQKGGSGTSWTIHDERSYDVWGSVRSGASSGGPRGRYCANLGHVQDDESGLVYMRARYYEPGSGRFISEDPAMDGAHWYVYVKNNPIGFVDRTGKYFQSTMAKIELGVLIGMMISTLYFLTGPNDPATRAMAAALGALDVAFGSVAMLLEGAGKADGKVGCLVTVTLIAGFGLFGAIAFMMFTCFLLIHADEDQWGYLMGGE